MHTLLLHVWQTQAHEMHLERPGGGLWVLRSEGSSRRCLWKEILQRLVSPALALRHQLPVV